MLKRGKKVIALVVLIICLLFIVIIFYSSFREEWYQYDTQELYEYIDCSEKDILEIYTDVTLALDNELEGYDLVQVVLILDCNLQQVEFTFYEEGTFFDVKSKKILVSPQENAIKELATYQGNIKAYGGATQTIDIETVNESYQENIGIEGLKKVVYNEYGVRIY